MQNDIECLMKRDIIHVIITLIAVSLNSTVAIGQSGLRPRGDVNCDWEVNIGDVNTLVDAVLNETAYHSFYTYAHDINGDKEINIADVNMAIQAIYGKQLPPMPSYSGTLPVLYINTEGHRDIVGKEKEDYLHAGWWLDAMGLEGCEPLGTSSEPLGLLVKGRGNSSWANLDKKPLRLKLDEKQPMLGMPSSRHWVLLPNADYWMGPMCDMLPFELGRQMGMSWNPLIKPVEVVLNGQYIGLYMLAEQVRVSSHRVDIQEQNDGETNPEKVTGGWLLEIDNYIEVGNITFTEGNGRPFWITPHSPEVLSEQQRQYITDFLTRADKAIYSRNKSSTAWEQYIDIDSLAIYYIVQEVIDNPEAFSGSCYLHKQRGEDSKLIFGPLWDCGSSFHRYSSSYLFNDFIYENLPWYCQSRWIGEIAKYPHFQQRVRHHWQRFVQDVYPMIDAYIDKFVARVETAGNYDHKRWPQNPSDNFTARINNFYKPCLGKKVAWLQSQWGE